MKYGRYGYNTVFKRVTEYGCSNPATMKKFLSFALLVMFIVGCDGPNVNNPSAKVSSSAGILNSAIYSYFDFISYKLYESLQPSLLHVYGI